MSTNGHGKSIYVDGNLSSCLCISKIWSIGDGRMKKFLDKEVTLGGYIYFIYIICVLAILTFLDNKYEEKEQELEDLQESYFELREENWELKQDLQDQKEIRTDIQIMDEQWNEREAQQKNGG